MITAIIVLTVLLGVVILGFGLGLLLFGNWWD